MHVLCVCVGVCPKAPSSQYQSVLHVSQVLFRSSLSWFIQLFVALFVTCLWYMFDIVWYAFLHFPMLRGFVCLVASCLLLGSQNQVEAVWVPPGESCLDAALNSNCIPAVSWLETEAWPFFTFLSTARPGPQGDQNFTSNFRCLSPTASAQMCKWQHDHTHQTSPKQLFKLFLSLSNYPKISHINPHRPKQFKPVETLYIDRLANQPYTYAICQYMSNVCM